ncbi:MAG: copper amine oxidase N-terminal domain-containing protein [Defluviitaleaceae bacterium]|nr:copper amine oxidase N-terminal domain-containing protein [Defluviitaleaceae bacterium]
MLKKKVAVILALVMVLSLLPMSVFGLRPAHVTELIRPNDDALNYLVTFDAEFIAGAVAPANGTLFLEFEISGDNAGFRIFRNNAVRIAVGDTNTGVVRDYGERPWPSTEVPSWATRYTGVQNLPLAFRLDMGNQFTSPGALGGPRVGRDQLAGQWPTELIGLGWTQPVSNLATNAAPNNTVQAVEDAVTGYAASFGGEFTNGLRRRLPGDRNHSAGDTGEFSRNSVGMEHWRTLTVDLDSLLGPNRTESRTIPAYEGWITAQLPMTVPNPGATVTVRLRSMTGAGHVSTLRTLPAMDLVGPHANGIQIESRGVVPMTNLARLNPLRITEDIPGMLQSMPGTNSGMGNEPGQTQYHIVRLVAPRGFRWDTGEMPGYLTGQQAQYGISLTGSNVHFDGSGSGNNPIPGGATALLWTDNQVNQTTDRHEIYIQIVVPPRTDTLASRSRNSFVDIEGLILIPVHGAPTTGDVAIDVWVGTTNGARGNQWDTGRARAQETAGNATWGSSQNNPRHVLGNMDIFVAGRNNMPDGSVFQTRFGWFGENDAPGSVAPSGVPGWRESAWSRMNVVVANLDHEGGITVSGPANPAQLTSGRVSDSLVSLGNVRFMHDGNQSIRLTENTPRALFGSFDSYELRIMTEGVHFVDAEIRAGANATASDDFGWTSVNDNEHFVSALTEFTSGSLHFAPRTMYQEEDARLRHMDIRLMLSVEAGFEANFGGEVEIDVIRNGVSLGSAVVANVTDPIRMEQSAPEEILRHQFDVIPLTRAGSFAMVEVEPGTLRNNEEFWFHVQATQNGRPVYIPQGMLALFLGDVEVNAESGIVIEPIRAGGNPPRSFPGDRISDNPDGFRVVRNSSGTPARISFNNVYVAGPAVPGVQWHVVVSGATAAYGSVIPTVAAGGELVRNHGRDGITPNSHRYFPNRINTTENHIGQGQPLGIYQERARMFGLGYHAHVLSVVGDPHIDGYGPGEGGGGGGGGVVTPPRGRLTLRHGMPPMQAQDGSMVNDPFILHSFVDGIAVSMLNPRIFADFIGGEIEWIEATSTINFSGPDANGNHVTVSLTNNSNRAIVSGQNVDIATFAANSGPANSVNTIIIDGRSFVPLRFLANAFLLPISFQDGTVVLG